MQAIRKCWMILDGQRWLFDEASWTLADWFVIKNVTGLGRLPFINGVLDEDPAALQALVWFLRRTDEPNLRLEEVQFRPAALEWDSVEEPDAVPPSGEVDADELPTTSKNDGTTTSTSLPSGATSAPATSMP